MKKTKQAIIAVVLSFLLLFCMGGCYNPPKKPTPPEKPVSYTEDELLQRLIERVEAHLFADMVAFKAELVYDFNEEPNYFLVEYEFFDEFRFRYQTRYGHLLGYISHGNFYRGLNGAYDDAHLPFMYGRSPYAVCGYADEKKYCGGDKILAIKSGEELTQIFECTSVDFNTETFEFDSEEWQWTQKTLTEEERQEIQNRRYRGRGIWF